VLYIDEESDYVGAYLLAKKSEQEACYLRFRTLLESRTGVKVIRFKSDGGG
jgi:hypothetical protein